MAWIAIKIRVKVQMKPREFLSTSTISITPLDSHMLYILIHCTQVRVLVANNNEWYNFSLGVMVSELGRSTIEQFALTATELSVLKNLLIHYLKLFTSYIDFFVSYKYFTHFFDFLTWLPQR